jgi:hypothetical protein
LKSENRQRLAVLSSRNLTTTAFYRDARRI